MSERRLAIHPQFHGWRLVGFSAVSQLIALGFTVYVLGLYIQPLASEFGVSPGKLGWGMAMFYLMSSAIGPLLGYWVDRGAARQLMTLGAGMLALGFVCAGISTALWQIALACIVLIAPGSAMLGVLPCSALLVQWFDRRRSFAVGIAVIGISVGGFIMPPVTNALIESMGWRGSLISMGVFVAAFLMPLAWLMVVGKPADVAQWIDGEVTPAPLPTSAVAAAPPAVLISSRDIVSQRAFWLLVGTVGLLSMCSIMMVAFLVPYARVSGISSEVSALLVSLYAGSAVLGKFTLGWLGDRFSKRHIMVLVQVIAILGWGLLVLVKSAGGLMAAAAMVGFSVGGMTPLWATLVAYYFGPGAFGRVKGIMTLTMTVFLIIPGPLGGYLYDRLGSYEAGFAIVWWVLPVALLCAVLLPAKPQLWPGAATQPA